MIFYFVITNVRPKVRYLKLQFKAVRGSRPRIERSGFILTVPLSTQVHKWVLANLVLGVTL